MSGRDAQHVLAIFSDPQFYESGLPEDNRAGWLWPIALSEPVISLNLRERLIFAAVRAGRNQDVAQLIRDAPIEGRWIADERASFASLAAGAGRDWRAAEAWLASGGRVADGYSIVDIRLEIDRARLMEGYDASAAARVATAMIEPAQLGLFLEDNIEALKAAGAVAEMRRGAEALVARGRNSQRSFEDRSSDFGAASMLFEGAGDLEAALGAAREGAVLTPEAVAERPHFMRDASGATNAELARMANGFGTLPVERLYRLGAHEEALANGYLAGRDRYLADLDAGRRPDPAWIISPGIEFELKVVVPALAARRATRQAAELLARLEADPAAWEAAGSAELMMLAAIAGDSSAVDAIFEDAIERLDIEEPGGWSALLLVIGRRAADAALGRPQSP